jgi:4-hydroxybenzoate polyprenyltransferase
MTTAIRSPQSAIRNYVDLARPFTLVAPALGFISGALTAIGAAARAWAASLLIPPISGRRWPLLTPATTLNQIYDLEIDRQQPKRPLTMPTTIAQAWRSPT